MDACMVGGEPNGKVACANVVGDVQTMIDKNGAGAGAATRDSLMEGFVVTAKDDNELGIINNAYEDVASTADINADDIEHTSGTFIPNAPLEMKPKVGMEFASLDDAFDFYNRYAWHCGFSVRKDTSRKNKAGVICMRILRCSKAGFRNKKVVQGEPKNCKACPLTHWCCAAKIMFNLCVNGSSYGVTTFVEAHNHVLCTLSKTNWLRSHKRLTEDHLNMITTIKKSRIGVARSIDFMREVGGPHLGFSERDVQNVLIKKRQTIFGSDADALLCYFQIKQIEDPQFTYDIVVDENKRLQSCFWVDRKSKEDYMAFNDVICFDTTYKTNEFDMPFGPFVGVNHHMQTVLVGVGLLFSETVEDFQWLFQTWLDAVGNIQPKTIITDQDPVIKQAIATVFPNSHHIFSLWHINKKLSDKLSHIIHEHPTFKATWNNCLYGSTSIEDYERTWSTMIEDFQLHANSWLSHMYDIRAMWIPAYTKGIFSAGMRTIGWSESMNAFFDSFVNRRSSLMDFVNGYEKALEKWREDETEADFQNVDGRPVLRTRCGIEATMAKIYTSKVFEAFQQEVEESMYYIANSIASEGVIQQWHVFKFDNPGDHNGKKVSWNEDDMVASCPCMKFESCGIVCQHVLTLFRFKGIVTMPAKQILVRWTRFAKSQFKQLTDFSSISASQSIMLRGYILSKHWSFLLSKALSNLAAFEVVNKYMEKATTKVLELPRNNTIENAGNEQLYIESKAIGDAGDDFNLGANEVNIAVGTLLGGSSGAMPSQSSQAKPVLSSPIRHPHKGRSSTRMKGHLERSVGGTRFCHGCHKHVVGHDKRTCPELKELTSIGKHEDTSEVHTLKDTGRGRCGGDK